MLQISQTSEIKELIRELIDGRNIRSIYFVGCGASRSDLYPACYLLSSKARYLRSSLHTANEFVLATMDAVDETAVVITCSLSGTTPETVKATSVAKSRGAVTIALTNDPASPLTKDADAVVTFEWQGAYSVKEDKTIKALLLAAELLDQIERYPDLALMHQAANQILPLIDSVTESIIPKASLFANTYKDMPILYVTSSGAMQELAWSFAACLMMEMQWIPSSTYNVGDFFHGPFEVVEKGVPYLLLMNDGPTRPMDERARTFLERFEAGLTVVDAKDLRLSEAVPPEVKDFFNPVLLGAVLRVYAEKLAEERNHPLSQRRYMWKMEY